MSVNHYAMDNEKLLHEFEGFLEGFDYADPRSIKEYWDIKNEILERMKK